MTAIDTVARADIAQAFVQLHQLTTALLQTVAALDNAFQALERVLPLISEEPGLTPDRAEEERQVIMQARAEILNTRLYLHKNLQYRRS